MKIKNEEYAQRFLPLPNGHTLPKCKVIKTFLNWLNEIAVIFSKKNYNCTPFLLFLQPQSITINYTHYEKNNYDIVGGNVGDAPDARQI